MTITSRNFIALATLLLMMIPMTAVAKGDKTRDGEHPRGPHHSVDPRLGHLAAQLNLSDAQQEALRPVLERQANEMRAIRERKHAGDEDLHTLKGEMRALRAANSQEIESMLDEEQRVAFEGLRDTRQQRLGKHDKKHMGEHKEMHKDGHKRKSDSKGPPPDSEDDPS